MMSRYRSALLVGAFALNFGLAALPASAALDMVIGQPAVVTSKPFADCSTRAKNALSAVMQNAVEAGTGSGNWVGVQRLEGSVAATGVIECHPIDTGYEAAFTCAVQVPPNPDTANALCAKLSSAFNAATTGYAGGPTWH